MTILLSLPQVGPVLARKQDSRALLPLGEYDHILVSFSGGKDSLATVLNLLEQAEEFRNRLCILGEQLVLVSDAEEKQHVRMPLFGGVILLRKGFLTMKNGPWHGP